MYSMYECTVVGGSPLGNPTPDDFGVRFTVAGTNEQGRSTAVS